MKNILCIIFLLFNISFYAQEHSHDHAANKPEDHAEEFTSEKFTEKYEVLIKHHDLTIEKEEHLDLYISDYKTNQPLDVKLNISSPTDKQMKVEVHREEAGTYELHLTFKERKKYSLNLNIDGPNGVDLIQINDIEVGKIVEVDEEKVSNQSTSFWQSYGPYFLSIVFFGLGLLFGLLYYKRKGLNTRTMSIVILLTFMTLTVNETKAHEGHGDAFGGGDHASSVEVPKETQFLFNLLTSQVGSSAFNASIQLYGTVIPSNGGSAIVSTPQTGRVSNLLVKIGDKVRKGQKLCTISTFIDVNTQVALDGNKISIMQIEAEKNTLNAEYEAAKKENDRLQKIADIISKRDIDEAKSRLAKAESNLALFNKNLGKGSSLGSVDKLIHLYAPINGILNEFNLVSGSTVNIGQELFKINNIDKVYVEGQIYDRDIPHLNKDAKFEAQCVNADHKATIKMISTPLVINSENQSQKILFELENKTGEFKIGEFVNIRMFSTHKDTRAISLPNSSITEINGKPVIFIKDAAEHYHLSYVNTGENNGMNTTITKGLEGGERVIVNGTYQMKMIYLNQ